MLQTRAEATNYRETSLHADVMAFVHGLAALGAPGCSSGPGRGGIGLHVTSFGESPQGRALPLLVLSTRGVRTPEDARRVGLPVVLMLDGIHPGEVEGKEASLALARDLLTGRPDPAGDRGEWLDGLTLLVAPLFNPDGNDALDPANRRLDLAKLHGQLGPVVGTRTQSHGINLNRDYMRHAAPEMRLLQRNVCVPWAADLTIDNHATNGSVHRMDMTVDVPHTVASGRSEPIALARDRMVPEVIAAVARRGVASGWYGNFVEDERALDQSRDADPNTTVGEGWMTYPHHPRFGSNYRGLTGRMDILLECYSYLPFERRVETARAWQCELLRWVAANGADVLDTVARSRVPPDRIAVRYALERAEAPVVVPTRSPRTLDGAPVEVTLPHLSRFVGVEVVDRPRAYLVPQAVADHLAGHGLDVRPADGFAGASALDVQIARVESVGAQAGRAILEASATGDVTVSWRNDRRVAPPGWWVVPTDQPLGAIAAYLCEPHSDDGLVENGVVAPVPVGGDHPAWRIA